MTTQQEHCAGDVIADRYRLTALIGEGGMGAVWSARNLTLDVDVAIKLVHRDSLTADMRQRLLHEARAAARLAHPSIVRVFEFGETERGAPFIAMELLRGEALVDVLDRVGAMDPATAVALLLPVVSALSTAHAMGVIHRDLKPENIMMVNDESGAIVPKLLDFGIAKMREREGGDPGRITRDSAVMGTPDYMSPEQGDGMGLVDERADVWAVTVLLYQMISGERPFEAPTCTLTLVNVAMKEPRPLGELDGVDEQLWSILQRGLAKKRAKRWQSMREIGAALGTWAIEHGVETDVAGSSIAAHWLAKDGRTIVDRRPPAPLVRISGQESTLRAPGSSLVDSTSGISRASAAPRPPMRSRWPWIVAGFAAALVPAFFIVQSRLPARTAAPQEMLALPLPRETAPPSLPSATAPATARPLASSAAPPAPSAPPPAITPAPRAPHVSAARHVEEVRDDEDYPLPMRPNF